MWRTYRSQCYIDLADETGLPALSDVDQHPSFHERSFPKGTGTGKTRWFRSSSVHQLLCPNEDIVGAVGDLYVHTNIRSKITYLWVMHPDEGWVSIKAGGDHPTMPNRRLRIRKNGDPSWVQTRSLISMDSRERRRWVLTKAQYIELKCSGATGINSRCVCCNSRGREELIKNIWVSIKMRRRFVHVIVINNVGRSVVAEVNRIESRCWSLW